MYPLYEDITKRLGEPLWWDEHGVPRYDPFAPSMLDVYSKYAALSVIRCQGCGKKFQVGVSWSIARATTEWRSHGETKYLPDGWDKDGNDGKPITMPSTQDGPGEFGYGDAPWHKIDNFPCAGTTETAEHVECLEFWELPDQPGVEGFMIWHRMPEHEVAYEKEDRS